MWLSRLPGAAPGLVVEFDSEFGLLGWTCVLALVIVIGVLSVVWARKWYQSLAEPSAEPTLEDFRKLLETGLLEPHEFERIRARLEDRGGPPAEPLEIRQGIQDPQLHTGVRRLESNDPPSATPPLSDPTS